MPSIIPRSRPLLSRAAAESLLRGVGVSGPAILGIRGYYKDTMGVAGANDRGLYDDAIAVVGPNAYRTFNANTDPSTHGGHLAVLAPGTYHYKLGTHHPGTEGAYTCLVQDGPVTVQRDDGVRESGEFYIHIHRGGFNVTSSLGCQTIPPNQYDEFMQFVFRELGERQTYALIAP
jgi:lysozyme